MFKFDMIVHDCFFRLTKQMIVHDSFSVSGGNQGGLNVGKEELCDFADAGILLVY